jgi:hypothetical protein
MNKLMIFMAALLSLGSVPVFANSTEDVVSSDNATIQDEQGLNWEDDFDALMRRERWRCMYRSGHRRFTGVDRDRRDAIREAHHKCRRESVHPRRCDFVGCDRIGDRDDNT